MSNSEHNELLSENGYNLVYFLLSLSTIPKLLSLTAAISMTYNASIDTTFT